jgi:hypothetical protein
MTIFAIRPIADDFSVITFIMIIIIHASVRQDMAQQKYQNDTRLCLFFHCFLILPIASLGLWRPLNVPPQATQ